MRLIIVAILNLFLSVVSVNGQTNDTASHKLSEKFRFYIRPEIKDSVHQRLDSLTPQRDSLKILGYYDRRRLLKNPYLRPRHFNDDEMVYNPGPSYDRMPNADVTTPGVHYTLKIKKIASGYYTYPYRFYPPHFPR